MDLEGEEAFEGGVLFVGVGEVGTEFSIEPGLKVVALALDDDGVPVVPFKELFSLCGEGCEFFFRCFVSVRREPSSTGFVKDARSPRAFAVLEVVVFTLIASDATIGFLFSRLFVQGAEHAARVTVFVVEFELEGEDEVPEFFFSAKEGVAFDLFAKAANGSVFDFIFGGASSFAPASEVFAIEEGFKARFC